MKFRSTPIQKILSRWVTRLRMSPCVPADLEETVDYVARNSPRHLSIFLVDLWRLLGTNTLEVCDKNEPQFWDGALGLVSNAIPKTIDTLLPFRDRVLRLWRP
jgi:hypothetical protein